MPNRDRRGRDRQSEWDWDYYYEQGYAPARNADYYGTGSYGRDYADNSYYGPYYRSRDYNRDYDYSTYGTDYPSGWSYGRYTGYGPREYKRSDARILEDVNERLTWHSMIDASDINVAVDNGVVTLTGSVDTRGDKRLAEDIADDVPGVWDVENQLSIRNKRYERDWSSRNEFRPGLEVIDRDGNHVGEVTEVRNGDFRVERPMARDVYIPFADCDVHDGKVQLNVRSAGIDRQGWMMPEPAGTQRSQQKR